MKNYCVYILKCKNGSYYVGQTSDLENRMTEHTLGTHSSYIKKLLPVEIVFTQHFPDRHQAFLVERRIKGWTRKKKEALIKGDWKAIQELAKKEFK